MNLLDVDALSVGFGPKTVVRDVSFTLDRGETLAIVGESGSGKTLTALALLGLLPAGAAARGTVRLDGTSVLTAPPGSLRQLRGGVGGMIFQEPMTSLNPLHRIGRQVSEALTLHGRSGARAPVIAALARAGFPDAGQRLDAYPHQLSGGQRQRVMIAMALANDPALLIADEPTTALDVTTEAAILSLLDTERDTRGLAVLLITHDLGLVARHAQRVCVMQDGAMVEAGPVGQIFHHARHPYTKLLLAAAFGGEPAPKPGEAAPVVLSAADVSVRFGKPKRLFGGRAPGTLALDGVSLDVRAGETVGLVGESGSGKTTFGFACLGLQPADGRIVLCGTDVRAASRRALRAVRARAGIVFQDPFGSLSPRLSVGAIIAEGLLVHAPDLSRADRAARVTRALRDVGLPPGAADRYPHEFSGGQRQRIAIARALILSPTLLVLDEPTSALDRSVQAQIVDLLRDLQAARGIGYLFISHDLRVVAALAHRVCVLRAGRVEEFSDAAAFFAGPRSAYGRALLTAAGGTLDANPADVQVLAT